MISYALLLGFCVFRPVVLQLLYKDEEDVRMNQCPFKEVILPAHVTNLQKHKWNLMLVTWKYGGVTMYSFNGESGAHKNNGTRFGLQNLKNEDIQSGDVSLHFLERPPNGGYTCETTELSTEGSKTVEMAYKEEQLFKASSGIIAILTLLAVVNTFEVIFFVKCLHLKCRSVFCAYFFVGIGIVLIIAGLNMFQTGNSWNLLQKAGLVVAVCLPLLFFLISDVLFGCKIKDHRFRMGWFCCCVSQIVSWIIAIVGAIMCMQDCPPNPTSEIVLIVGLLLHTIIEIADICCCSYCCWLKHKEDCSVTMANATSNSNKAIECEPLSTKS